MITRKSRDEIKRMRHAGHIVALVHKKMKEVINRICYSNGIWLSFV